MKRIRDCFIRSCSRKGRILLPGFVLALSLGIALSGCTSSKSGKSTGDNIRIGVTIYDSYDSFISQLMDCFDRDRGEDVTVVSYNAAQSQKTQNSQVQEMMENGCNVVCVNLVDRTAPTQIIDMAKKNNIPVIFFNRELVAEDLLQWNGLYYVGADAVESGILQGKLALNEIRKIDSTIDRNNDGIIQYLVLEGEAGHQDAIVRTEYSVNTLLEAGVKVDKVGNVIANWNRQQAQTKVKQLIDKGTYIELLLANNDDMALGAIDSYRTEGIPRSEWPVIYGIDGTKQGLESLKNGDLAGTVYNDKEGQAKAMYDLAYALSTHGSTESLGLKDGKYIRLPYSQVTADNVQEFTNRQ